MNFERSESPQGHSWWWMLQTASFSPIQPGVEAEPSKPLPLPKGTSFLLLSALIALCSEEPWRELRKDLNCGMEAHEAIMVIVMVTPSVPQEKQC